MKNFNKEEYNRLCANLLGEEKKGDDVTWTFPEYLNGKVWVDEHFFDGTDEYCGRRQTEVSELKFHSDWNWIMEVRNKILSINQFSLTGQRFKFNMYGCAKHKRDEEDMPYKVRVGGVLSSEKFPSIEINGFDEKEAVVQAIWEFLNWYKENKE